MTNKTAILIPARYWSTRFAGKPLCDLGGKTLIRRVYEKCAATGLDVYVLTDHEAIVGEVDSFGGRVASTGPASNGTERCRNSLQGLDKIKHYDKFINVQGDMPDIDPNIILLLKAHLESSYTPVTLYTDLKDEEKDDPNTVKLVVGGEFGTSSLWFGRGMKGYGHKHLGIYGYKRSVLEEYPRHECEEEKAESLEQLRWLKNGLQLKCYRVVWDGIEINTPADQVKWNNKHGYSS